MTAVNPGNLVEDLHRRGVVLALRGDRLRVEAPAGVLTADVRQTPARHKADLPALLIGEASPIRARGASWSRVRRADPGNRT